MDWPTIGVSFGGAVLGGGLVSAGVDWWRNRHLTKLEKAQDHFVSYEKQIASAEKRGDLEMVNRLRVEYEEQQEAWRAQQDLGLIAPKEVGIEARTVSESDIAQLRELLAKSANVRPGTLSAEDYILRGNAYFKVGEYDNAVKEYSVAIRMMPAGAGPYVNRGVAYGAKGDDGRAIEDYDEAIKVDSRAIFAYNNRGIWYFHKGENNRAIEDFNKAIQVAPRYANAYSNRGNVYLRKGEYDRSIHDYDAAISLAPSKPFAYSSRALAHALIGNAHEAQQDATKAIEILRKGIAAHDVLGSAYACRSVAHAVLGNQAEAQRDIDRAVKLGFDASTVKEDIEQLKSQRESP